MFYIRTADKLQRTAPWVAGFEGGVEKLREILINDSLGICADLEAEMDNLIGTYKDEWAVAIADPNVRKTFKQFANTVRRFSLLPFLRLSLRFPRTSDLIDDTDSASPLQDERQLGSELIEERGQKRPADWPQQFPTQRFTDSSIATPRSSWQYVQLASVDDLQPTEENTTSCAVRYGQDTSLAIFHVPRKGYFCTMSMCPHKRAFILEHGIIGDDANGNLYVSCPLHKRNFRLDSTSSRPAHLRSEAGY